MALTKVIGDGLGSTNDLTVDTTTLTVDATNNRVGIGTASPSEVLHVNSGSGNIGIRVESTDSLALAAFKDNSTSDVVLAGASGDNLAVSHDILFTNASKGVYLGVTSATASNLLDDYEEGTFTPTWSGYSTQASTSGRFVKVGNQVTVYAKLVTGTSNDGSSVSITNLPFTISGDIGAGSIYHNTSGLRDMHIVTSFNSDSTTCRLHGVLSGTDTTIKYSGSDPQIGNSSTLMWILHYQTI